MSLLMDALKKAEQEKKEAARRQQEGGPSLEKSEGDQQQADNLNNTWEHDIADESAGSNISADNTMRSSTAELELEPITQQKLDADTTSEFGDTTSEIGDTTSEIGDTTSEFSVAETSSEDPTLNVTINDLALSELADEDLPLAETPVAETEAFR